LPACLLACLLHSPCRVLTFAFLFSQLPFSLACIRLALRK